MLKLRDAECINILLKRIEDIVSPEGFSVNDKDFLSMLNYFYTVSAASASPRSKTDVSVYFFSDVLY